jgi:hypothetical protein
MTERHHRAASPFLALFALSITRLPLPGLLQRPPA